MTVKNLPQVGQVGNSLAFCMRGHWFTSRGSPLNEVVTPHFTKSCTSGTWKLISSFRMLIITIHEGQNLHPIYRELGLRIFQLTANKNCFRVDKHLWPRSLCSQKVHMVFKKAILIFFCVLFSDYHKKTGFMEPELEPETFPLLYKTAAAVNVIYFFIYLLRCFKWSAYHVGRSFTSLSLQTNSHRHF